MERKFFICEHCGNVLTFVKDAGVPVSCCGEKMREIEAGVTDAAKEKHVPLIEKDGNEVVVTVGSVSHPMQEAHFIEWIVLETKQGCQIKSLQPNKAPQAKFALADGDEAIAAYAYCNLHGLWKA